MWRIDEIEAVSVALDFSSSGQGRRSATAITAAGVCLFNAIELVDVEPEATQVEVCGCCGFSRCSPGGWVTFRRIGERVVWIPAWDEMDKGSWEAAEYRPPPFLRSKGVPAFSPASWERLRALHEELPVAHDLPWVNSREAALLCQWSAPGRLLGEYPSEPRVRRELFVAVTNGDLATELSVVDRCLHEHHGAVRPMTFVPGHVAVRPIELWLDLPSTPSWTSFAYVENNVCVVIDGMPLVFGNRTTLREPPG